MKQNIHKGAPTIKVRNKLHGKMFLPTIITTLHNNLRENQENEEKKNVINVECIKSPITEYLQHIQRLTCLQYP
jgi:hypothetical protein